MGKKKIVIDTNVLISSLGWEGNPKEIFRRTLAGEFELIISEKQLEELKQVMDYPKFSFIEDQKSRFLTMLLEIAKVVKTSDKIKIIKEDPDDNIIIESAFENNAQFIISGDAHLLKLKKYSNVKIVTPAKFLELIKN